MRKLTAALAAAAVAAGVAAAPASADSDPPAPPTLRPSQILIDRLGQLLLRPDLTISAVELDRSRGRLTVSVTNAGFASAPGSITRVAVSIRNPIDLTRRTVRIIDVPTRPLAPGQTRVLPVDLDGHADRDHPVSPFAEIAVTADAAGGVVESDEENNARGILGRPL